MRQVADITVETWLELQAIDVEDEFDRSCQVISILRDMSLDEVLDMPAIEATLIARDLLQLTYQMAKTPSSQILIDDEDFYPLPFEEITFGAFIDLESLFTKEYRDNVPKILSILYRRQLSPGYALEPAKFEEYEAHHLQRSDLFLQVPVRLVHSHVAKYVAWRDKLLTAYEGLFGGSEDDDEGQDSERLTAEESKAKAHDERVKKWSWQLLLWKLSNNNPLHMEEATRMPVLGAMNILSMIQELKIEQ
jgi:hypothetical protein